MLLEAACFRKRYVLSVLFNSLSSGVGCVGHRSVRTRNKRVTNKIHQIALILGELVLFEVT